MAQCSLKLFITSKACPRNQSEFAPFDELHPQSLFERVTMRTGNFGKLVAFDSIPHLVLTFSLQFDYEKEHDSPKTNLDTGSPGC